MHENTEAVRSLYEAIAARYDARYTDPFARIYDDVTWHHLERPLAALPRDTPILDLAAGTGYVALELLARGFSDITATDLSPAMLEVLAEKLRRAAPERAERVRTEVADFHDLRRLPAAHYGAIFCQGSALNCSHDPARALVEMRRLLRPGGLLSLSVHNRTGSVEKILLRGRPHEVGAAVARGLWYWYEGDRPMHELHLFTEPELCRLAGSLGLLVESLAGKLILSRSFVERLTPGSELYAAARAYCLEQAKDPRLRAAAEYLDAVFRLGA